MNGRILLMLHSHIPYVKRQGRWPFGEVWLFEAMAETYIPLLNSLIKLNDEGVNAPLTFSFTPVLLEQLNSKYIKHEFVEYLQERESMAGADERYYLSTGENEYARLAAYYRAYYRDIRRDFEIEFDRNIIQVLKQLQNQGRIEIITTAATHAYLPLLDQAGLETQVYWGKELYNNVFDREPEGFWLPECGYFQGIEDILIKNGFKYFFVDSHAIEGGKPIGISSHGFPDEEIEIETFASTGLSTYRPYTLKDNQITVFGRNAMVSHQVWSADYGYPGDENYREFHKHSMRSGFKYWKVTDRNQAMDKKQVYNPEEAQLKIKQQSWHFVNSLVNTAKNAAKLGFASPLIVGCYDTELFGHWWWEGVDWLEAVIRCINDNPSLELVLPTQVGKGRHEAQVFESSWGMGGKHYVWENTETAWMWDIIRQSGREFEALKSRTYNQELADVALSQALKELMLIQSSDWLFMVSNNLTRDYAMKRFFEHYAKLLRISNSLQNDSFDETFSEWLNRIQYEDDFFSCL
ncbi:MAG: glycoside hydrolase family 57 protein [Syntrophomonadaceae bacterium]|nr:glycoside hydrolase family 57 protein [Syntrophomonadaceae bacterium]